MARVSDTIETLRLLRLKQDVSYRHMAEAIGISPMALYNVLKDISVPTDRTLYKIQQYLKRERVTS